MSPAPRKTRGKKPTASGAQRARKKAAAKKPSSKRAAAKKSAAKKSAAKRSGAKDTGSRRPRQAQASTAVRSVKPPPADLEVDAEALAFIEAIDRYRTANGRPFPTWSEVLQVLKGLGYRKG